MTAKHIYPQIFDVKNHALPIRKDVLILTLLLLTGLLLPGTFPVLASSQSNAHSIETITPLSPSTVCPVSVSFGETIQCSIATPGEIDTYTFSASAGDKVLVRMGRSSGNLWPEIIIKDTGGIILCDDYDTITAEITSCSLSTTGTYSILADDHLEDYTGDYYLYLQRLNNPGNPTVIAFGQTLPGSITTAAEMDTFTFSATAGDKVLVRMGRSSGNLWPEIRIYGPDGVMLCDDYDTITAEIATCSLIATGTHTILAYDGIDSAYTGDYYLYLQRLNNPGSPTVIAFGQTLPGSITTAAEMDTYTFSATTGDRVTVRMSKSSGNLWPGIRIYNPDGTVLCETYGPTSAVITGCIPSATGTFTILAFDDFNGTFIGNYILFFANYSQINFLPMIKK